MTQDDARLERIEDKLDRLCEQISKMCAKCSEHDALIEENTQGRRTLTYGCIVAIVVAVLGWAVSMAG